eukprot:TRINITY_DN7301_c0_g1_i2.p2 TRINITY_DN7301_c0_g1~~TRINITY_DN7301_c0_g1_i2.p2  ORF type:complete len:171 (-),score=32.52 TRINITY_DN7301_c0_g1_i2:47-559(-)
MDLDSVVVLDPVSGTWSTAAPLPTPRCGHQCALVGSLLYVVGGENGSQKDLDSVAVLDTVTGTWSTAAPLPTPRSDHQLAVGGNLLYVVGRGMEGGIDVNLECLDSAEVLDTVNGTWGTLEPGTPFPSHVPAPPEEVLCEYMEQPCARYTSASCELGDLNRIPIVHGNAR